MLRHSVAAAALIGTALFTGAAFAQSGKVTVAIPTESARSGTYRVAKVEGSRIYG